MTLNNWKNMKNKKKQKVVVITGASTGIGRATALEFAKRGDSVVLAGRNEGALIALADECVKKGGLALPIVCDVSLEHQVYMLAIEAINNFGRIDVWINNAAVSAMGNFEEIPIDDFRKVIETNIFGYIYGARNAITQFKKQKSGTLINISSVVGKFPQPFSTPYTMSKFAIRGLSLSLEQELSDEKDIHVCCVLPAVIDTPIFNHAANFMGKAVKAPEPISPAEDVAKAIVKLTKKPQREVEVGKLGPNAISLAFLKLFAPEKFDEKNRERVLKDHFKEEPAMPTHGNLYEPIKDFSSVSGGWLEKKEESSFPTGKVLLTSAAVGGALVGLSFLLKKSNNQQKTINREPIPKGEALIIVEEIQIDTRIP